MTDNNLLTASCRMALAAYLHDMGKFAERAQIPAAQEKDADGNTRKALNEALYCPDFQGRKTHLHAAYTAMAMDILAQHLPQLSGADMHPFTAWKPAHTDDSLIDAAAMHHRPETFLQWIIATADRLASGFDRASFAAYNAVAEAADTQAHNLYTIRQRTLFESIHLTPKAHQEDWRYPLQPLSVQAIFPQPASAVELGDTQAAQKQYHTLWQAFLSGLEKIPASHRQDFSLWLDHFDSLWQTYTHAIPSATAGNTRPDVSLYDHSKTTAALAVALWRYHADLGQDPQEIAESFRAQWETDGQQAWTAEKFLLIQGDFFGIQDFLFSEGGEAAKRAAKLLRGRSFYVTLLTDLAALSVLEALQLPATSQVINAAGKFLIVAPNTPSVIATLEKLQRDLDAWFLEHTYGLSNIGMVWTPACAQDFQHGAEGAPSPFRILMKRLFAALETRKNQRFDLCSAAAPSPIFEHFLEKFTEGVCPIDGRAPATVKIPELGWVSAMASDQIQIGQWLTNQDRVLVARAAPHALNVRGQKLKALGLPIFGWHLYFTGSEEESGRFDQAVAAGQVSRMWDFSLPTSRNVPLWNGYARRQINAYIPRFDNRNDLERERYLDLDEVHPDAPKSFEHLARDDQQWIEKDGGQFIGIEALVTLKGDVDNLGQIFQKGLEQPTFAKMASLSRQMNGFFAIYLPFLCASAFKNAYTVFAGGDDFFLIGPWNSTIRLAQRMQQEFHAYVAQNPEIHFSAGMIMTKSGLPIRQLARQAEAALEKAKHFVPSDQRSGAHPTPPKNHVVLWNIPVAWPDFDSLFERADRLGTLQQHYGLSRGYLYGLLSLVDMAEEEHNGGRPQSALWHSYFSYRTRRAMEKDVRDRGDMKDTEAKRKRAQQDLQDEVYCGIVHYRERYKIPLFTYLYQQRDA